MPPKIELPAHVRCVTVKGREYYYYQPGRSTANKAKPIRLPDDPRDPAWWEAYNKAANKVVPPIQSNAVRRLVSEWQKSPEWNALSPRTRREWERHCRRAVEVIGNFNVRDLTAKHMLELRNVWESQPATANNVIRCMSSMLQWSIPMEWRSDNPCKAVKLFAKSDGYEPWPWEVIEAAKAELRPDMWWAVALALYTGQRLGDCLSMKWNAIGVNGISVKQSKTGKQLLIPIHRDLRAVLEAIPRTAVTILTNTDGRPWRAFQTAWRQNKPKAVKEKNLVFHGLRKSAVVMLLEAGCTDAEVASITGQSREMIEHYARQVNQAKLAAAAILKWEAQ